MRFITRFLSAVSVGLVSTALLAGTQSPNVIIQPANVTDFGAVAIGQTVTRSVTLTAPPTNTLPISGVTLNMPAGFSVAPGGTCDALNVLPAGQSCTLNISYTPLSTSSGGGVVTGTCQSQAVMVVTGFVITCDTQNASQFALFAASAFNSAVPILSPLWITLLALGLLGFGARGALRRAKR